MRLLIWENDVSLLGHLPVAYKGNLAVYGYKFITFFVIYIQL